MSKNKKKKPHLIKSLTAKERVLDKTETRVNGINATVTLFGVYLAFVAVIFLKDGDAIKGILAVMTSVSFVFANFLALLSVTLVKFNQCFVHRNVCILSYLALFIVLLIYSQAHWINNGGMDLRFPFLGSWYMNIILQIIFVITYYALANQKTYKITKKYNRRKI